MTRRLQSLFRLRRLDEELNDEIQGHLDMATARYAAQGLPPNEARLAALRDFGGVAQTKEVYRDVGGIPALNGLLQDVRYGIRTLRATPLVTT
ncbi:MAG: permease prefix domain 1-containing protein, partial [Bradyrhizobium sp.]